MTREERIHEIVSISKKRLKEYYRAGVPEIALKRFEREKDEFLNHTSDKALDQLILFHELSETAHNANEVLCVLGTAASSIFTFLLGYQHPNPLPAHYYCEECGYYELGNKTFGDDLPEKVCPKCGFPLMRDGYSLPEEFAWGKKREVCFEYRIGKEFCEKAYATVEKHYAKEERIVTTVWWGTHGIEELDIPADPHPGGAIVLGKGKKLEDYDLGEMPDTGKARELGLDYVLLMPSKLMSELRNYLNKSQQSLDDIPCMMPEKMPAEIVQMEVAAPEDIPTYTSAADISFEDFVNKCGANHATIQDKIGDKKIPKSEYYSVLKENGIFCREDLFDEMLHFGMNYKDAFFVAEAIRTGHYFRDVDSEMELPNRVKAVAPQVVYLFPRGHVVEIGCHILRLANLMNASK